MRLSLKFVAVIAIIVVGIAISIWFMFMRGEEGPVSVEAVSDDGFLKLVMTLKKTKFTTNPREPIEINLTLINIGNQEITLTFHYKTKFDFMVYGYDQGDYVYIWSFDHISGPVGWSADPSTYPIPIMLEEPEINSVTLKPGEYISQILVWDQLHDNNALAGGWIQTVPAPKGRYRIEGFAGFSSPPSPWVPENPLRYFEYTLPDGRLIRTVLKTPGIDITLI